MSDGTGCPNRECDHSGDFTEIVWGETGHGVGAWVRCDCGTSGPFVLLSDALPGGLDAGVEARRLWNALPRDEAPGEATLPDGVALNRRYAERLRSLGLDVERAEVVEIMGRAYVRLVDGERNASLVAVRPAVQPERGMEAGS